MARFAQDLALDLGTSTTRVFVRGQGLQVEMPSVVAIETGTRKGQLGPVVAIGEDAKEMLGRTPEHLHAIRPIREGRVANYPLTEALAREALSMARGGQGLTRPRVLLCVPQGIDEGERRALQDSVREAGAKEVQLLPKSVAASVGAELPIHEAAASMVIDMGGGSTEFCTMSLGGVVELSSARIGGHTFDAAISGWIRERHGLLVGERSTEELKVAIGTADANQRPRAMRIRGRDINNAVPREIEFLSTDIQAAIQPALAGVVEGIRQAMISLSPDLVGDISEQGLVLTGGSSLLHGMGSFIGRQTGAPVVLAQDPLRATITGAGWLLEERTHLERVLL